MSTNKTKWDIDKHIGKMKDKNTKKYRSKSKGYYKKWTKK